MPFFCDASGRETVSKALLKVVAAGLMVTLAFALHAEIVDDLYSGKVLVADRSAATLESAANEALAEVLVKVSGNADVLTSPAVTQALTQAREQVQQYGYSRDTLNPAGWVARVEFGRRYITRLITQAAAPLWTANRPRVLVWMVLEREGVREFVSPGTAPILAQELMREFERRGVPAQFPLFDLADTTAIGLEQVWAIEGAALMAASQRYDLVNVLAGRVVALDSGNWAGDWSYIQPQNRLDRTISVSGSREFSVQGVALVANEMAARYAVAPSTSKDGGGVVPMSVTGVHDYSDYAAIVSWLESLELIEHANVRVIRPDSIELGLIARADAAQLATIIELNQRLAPVDSGAEGLYYQWQR